MKRRLSPSDRALIASLRRHLFSAALVPIAAGCGGGYNCPDDVSSQTWTLSELSDAFVSAQASRTVHGPHRLADCPPVGKLSEELSTDVGTYAVLPWDCSAEALTEEVDDECTYEIHCWVCCGYGRPLLDPQGNPVKSEVAEHDTWRGDRTPDPTGLSADERRIAGEHWLENARAEHSSVAGFHRFALDLLSHGAPPELLLWAQKAASQEVHHATDCFALASAYLGRPCGPAAMSLESAPVARSLAELAAWTARDGVVGETVASLLAAQCLRDATDPAVRAVLERIVREETEHAELALATLRWALRAGGEPVARAVRQVLASASFEDTDEPTPSRALLAHGVPCPQAQIDLTRACLRDVLGPLVEQLLPLAA